MRPGSAGTAAEVSAPQRFRELDEPSSTSKMSARWPISPKSTTGIRTSIAEVVSDLAERRRKQIHVPACPAWTIENLVAHLTAAVAGLATGNLPSDFLGGWANSSALSVLDEWNDSEVEARSNSSISDVLEEWAAHASVITAMMRGENRWPDAAPPLADRVIVTDAAMHEQDVYGALGIVRNRDSAQIKIAASSYIAILGLRLGSLGTQALVLDSGSGSGCWEPAPHRPH